MVSNLLSNGLYLKVLLFLSVMTAVSYTSSSEFSGHQRKIPNERRYDSVNGYDDGGDLLARFSEEEEMLPLIIRRKRAIFNDTKHTYPHRIPFKFHDSITAEWANKIRRVLRHVEDNVCVTFVEEPDFDPENNDYETNAYIRFIKLKRCSAHFGRGPNDKGVRNISPCEEFYLIIHEIFHALGVVHDHQIPIREKHFSTVWSNVRKGFGGQFKRYNGSNNVQFQQFDPSSVVMYLLGEYSGNGLEVMLPLREEEFMINNGKKTNLDNAFYDLNMVYKCRELFCNNDQRDCGLGYYARIKGQCRCVCPKGFNPNTRCKTLVHAKTYQIDWPDTDFTMYAGDADSCPPGFDKGVVHVSSYRKPMSLRDKFFDKDFTTYFWLCTRQTTPGQKPDWERMPMGKYCVVKPKGVPCTDPFKPGQFNLKANSKPWMSGNVGDVTISGNIVTIRYCCRNDKSYIYPMEFPVDSPFRLIGYSAKCPKVRGMHYREGKIVLFLREFDSTNKFPRTEGRTGASGRILHTQCHYSPPKYGCSETITLDAMRRYRTITTPGFETGNRERNRRCLYYFKAPPSSKLRVTFNTFDIDNLDIFNFRRFNPWMAPMILNNANYPKQVITESNFLFIEFWSSTIVTKSTKGVRFTVDVLLPQFSCYNITDQGAHYAGTKWVSESMEACLSWKSAVSCEDFPWNSNVLALLSSGNNCRNPQGALLQPWCYVYVNGKMCQRRYCDVCNRLDLMDRYNDCVKMIIADTTFCSKALQRFRCARTCRMPLNSASTTRASCKRPSIPDGGRPIRPLKELYQVGDKVHFECTLYRYGSVRKEMECRLDGWSSVPSACTACPKRWTAYGDRCWIWKSYARSQKYANRWCKYNRGSLFIIRNAADLAMIRRFKQTSTNRRAQWNTWINGKLNPKDRQWYALDTNEPVPFFNWSSNAQKHNIRYPYLYLIGEDKKNPGTFATTRRMRYRFFCELPRNNIKCFDTSSKCNRALLNVADFCIRPETQITAKQFCQKSCGFCHEGSKKVQCSDQVGNGYRRVSPVATVDVGQYVEYACSDGFYHVGGDLRRVCGVDGKLMGRNPICQGKPKPTDINKGEVRKRPQFLPVGTAFLLDNDGLRVPFDGTITHWHFYAISPGNLTFIVYWKDSKSSTYKPVGSNHVSVQYTHQAWSHPVPVQQRIRVKAGDIFGSFSTKVKVATNDCHGMTIELMKVFKQKAPSYEKLLEVKKPFTESRCLIPSLGITVAPKTV